MGSKGRPIYFDEELREISLMLLKAKIRWQIDFLKPYAENIILFVDEPILSALGSTSYIGVKPEETKRLLKDGGYLAWGIVPTTDSIKEETTDSLKKRFQESIERLSGLIPEDLLLSRILLTPSCGTGSRSIEDTLKVFRLLRSLKEALS